jgi:hypothetical protein
LFTKSATAGVEPEACSALLSSFVDRIPLQPGLIDPRVLGCISRRTLCLPGRQQREQLLTREVSRLRHSLNDQNTSHRQRQQPGRVARPT